jgi:hypothetical protein
MNPQILRLCLDAGHTDIVSSAHPLRVRVVGKEHVKRARVCVIVVERVKKTPTWIRTVSSASVKTRPTASRIPGLRNSRSSVDPALFSCSCESNEVGGSNTFLFRLRNSGEGCKPSSCAAIRVNSISKGVRLANVQLTTQPRQAATHSSVAEKQRSGGVAVPAQGFERPAVVAGYMQVLQTIV